VKCDEGKPSCHACSSTGRKCDGYSPIIEAPQDLSKALSRALSKSPSFVIFSSEKENQSFYFFLEKTAPQLTVFFGGDFWETLLLQAALYEPSIRHAILALGSLHAKFEQNHGLTIQSRANGWSDDFALKNYSRAINSLVEPLSHQGQQAVDVYLICSILFACLEVSCFHVKASFRLIISRQ
jgi:hypothetical protein